MKKEGQHKHFDNPLTRIAWLSISLLIILCLLILPHTTAQAQGEIEVPEGTIPTIDGAIGPDEWDDALKVEGIPPWRALYLKHDNVNLYAGFEATGYIDEFYFVFDPKGEGVSFDEGEDIKRCLEGICDDWFYFQEFGFDYDEQQDVEGQGFYNEETDITTYELLMPLVSTDAGGNDPDVWLSLMVAGLVQQAQEHMILNGGGGVKLKPKPPPPPALTKKYFKTKYGITLVDRDEKWSEEEKKWLDDLFKILPKEFWGKASLKTIERWKKHNAYFGAYDNKDTIFIYNNAHTLYDKFNGKSEEKQFKGTILHELVHAIQWRRYTNAYHDTLVTKWMNKFKWEWKFDKKKRFPIYKGNTDKLPTEYVKTNGKNPLEDMAESAMLYVLGPEVLKKKSPTRYDWLKTNLFGGKEYKDGKIK
ncbi:MAG: hypothetical protein H8E40_13645 [Chloroflexi bacterium]|nr:hypothetical protein [Chloroflexota bacterium]